jgi:hypothetical protein
MNDEEKERQRIYEYNKYAYEKIRSGFVVVAGSSSWKDAKRPTPKKQEKEETNDDKQLSSNTVSAVYFQIPICKIY